MPPRGCRKNHIGARGEQMMSWAVVVVGFMALMTFVIAMGRSSTGRYEGELRSKRVLAHRPSRSAREASTKEVQQALRHEGACA